MTWGQLIGTFAMGFFWGYIFAVWSAGRPSDLQNTDRQ